MDGFYDHFSSDEDASDDGSSEDLLMENLLMVKNNDRYKRVLALDGRDDHDLISNITNGRWEEIGRDISNNTHLGDLTLTDGALNDEKTSYLFRGLTSSYSLRDLWLRNNGLRVAGVRSMVPFLQNSNSLRKLNLECNNIQSEGFNFLCRALRDSPIERLDCKRCGIESIEIDPNNFPRNLKWMELVSNRINADGCREIAKLLRGGDATLTYLDLDNNIIDDEGVAILVDALQGNTSLKTLHLADNEGISHRGKVMLLKLVNDICSINATLQSSHTLTSLGLIDLGRNIVPDKEIQEFINTAIHINRIYNGNPEAASRQKVIKTQLHSVKRAALAKLQGVSQSLYGEINPLHLPEVLSLVGRRHGQGELYVALKSSIAEVISVVNRKKQIKKQLVCCKERTTALNAELVEIKRQLAYYETMSKELNSELAEMEAVEGVEVEDESCEAPRSKRRCY